MSEPKNGSRLSVNLNTVLNAVIIAGVLWLASFLKSLDTRLTRIEVQLQVLQAK
jgi:hypothetical protein